MLSAIHFAVEEGKIQYINALVGYPGVDINARNHAGESPLLYCSLRERQPQIVTCLLENGANIEDRNPNVSDLTLFSVSIVQL